MNRECFICGDVFKDGEMVELTVIAPYHEIPSKTSFSIGKPVEAYLDTLRHNKCPDGGITPDDYDDYYSV